MKKLRLFIACLLVVALTGILLSQDVIRDAKMFYSKSLKADRSIWVYRPASVTAESPCPVLIWLTTNYQNPGDWEGFDSGLTSLLQKNKVSPMLIVVPNTNTAMNGGMYYGGHLYMNSAFWGNWWDYIAQDVVEWVEANYPVAGGPGGVHDPRYWLISGFDLGGSGAARFAYKHSNVFSGFASWAGDLAYEAFPVYFEWVQQNETNGFTYTFPMAFLTYFLGAYAATYTPDPSSPWKGHFPLREGTGEVIDSVYTEWLKYSATAYAREYYAARDTTQEPLKIYLSGSYSGLSVSGAYPPFWPKFTEYFHDSLSAWGIDHKYEMKNFTPNSLFSWANSNFAPVPKFNQDMAITKPEILIAKVAGFSKWNPMVQIRNHGKDDAVGVKVFCEISDETAVLYSAQTEIASLKSLEKADVQFAETWTPPLHKNYSLKYQLENPGEENAANDSLTLTLLSGPVIDDFEGTLDRWQKQPGWKLSNYKPLKGGLQCLMITPMTSSAFDSQLELKTPFDLSQARSARFTFQTRFDLASTDSGMVQASSDNGARWQTVGSLCCDGEQNWLKQSFNLDGFVGSGFDNVRIRLRFVSNSGKAEAFWAVDNTALEVNSLTDVAETQIEKPADCILFDNYPNPFNASTTLSYQLPQAGPVNLSIYNSIGQHVITLADERQECGRHTVLWDGRDQNGVAAASGIYVYSLKAGDFIQQKKMVVLK